MSLISQCGDTAALASLSSQNSMEASVRGMTKCKTILIDHLINIYSYKFFKEIKLRVLYKIEERGF